MTIHVQPFPKRTARLPMWRRTYCRAQILLRKHNINLREIADESCDALSVVHRVLDSRHFRSVGYESVLIIRSVAERMLRERGWQGESDDLWGEYDALLGQRQEDTPPPEAA